MTEHNRDSEPRGKRKWQAHVNALAQSGLSRAEYCRRYNLAYHSLAYWQGKLGKTKKDSTPVLVPVTLPSETGRQYRAADRTGLHIVLPGKMVIAVGDNFCADTLKRLLAVLESR